MASIFTELVVDCADPERLARFWGAVLGWDRGESDDESVEVVDPAGTRPTLLFLRVPDEKRVKNRVHIDVNPLGVSQAEELERLLALGARHVDIGQGEQRWHVLADPEGNEFCLLRTTFDPATRQPVAS